MAEAKAEKKQETPDYSLISAAQVISHLNQMLGAKDVEIKTLRDQIAHMHKHHVAAPKKSGI